MSFNTSDLARNAFMLTGDFARQGYDWWWHSFTGHDSITGEERAFFVEYFAVNPELGGSEPVFGQLEASKEAGLKPSYVMVKAGAWGCPGEAGVQLHRFFAWDDVTIAEGAPYALDAVDQNGPACHADDVRLLGAVTVSEADALAHPEWMCDAGSMSWDLTLDKQVAFNVGYGASEPLRRAEAFAMYWHVQGMRTAVSGTVTLNGRTYEVDPQTSHGYSDKNWGSDFTSPWVWLSSNNLRSRITGRQLNNTCFDIGGGCPKAFGVELPRQLLSALWYEGEPYEFNFSKPWTHCHTEFEAHETDDQVVWHVEQTVTNARMVTDVTCSKSEMVLVNYEAPDGQRRHTRLWNGGTGTGRVQLFARKGEREVLIDDMDAFNMGCEYGEYDATEPYGAPEPETAAEPGPEPGAEA